MPSDVDRVILLRPSNPFEVVKDAIDCEIPRWGLPEMACKPTQLAATNTADRRGRARPPSASKDVLEEAVLKFLGVATRPAGSERL